MKYTEYVRGLYIGRFQPFHKGHMQTIQHILEEVDELIIGIAAAQFSHTLRNPLTAGERLEIIRAALLEAKVDMNRIWLLATQDIQDNALWLTHLKRLLPNFDIFYSNNPFTRMLCTEAGIQNKGTPIIERGIFEAAKIRQWIANGKSLEKYLYPSTIALLETWHVAARLKANLTTEKDIESTTEDPRAY